VQREDAQLLYGFASKEERWCFEGLLSAHRVGPALALAILGTYAPVELRRIVREADVASLCLVPGVGKQTAARLLIELKGRLDVPELDVVSVTGAHGSSPHPSAVAQVREALAGLGYSPEEVREVLRELDTSADASSLLRDALRLLGARRA
jgi:Holliday junction DNA helicase RuvA